MLLYVADIPIFEVPKLFSISSQIVERNYAELREKTHMVYIKMLQEKYFHSMSKLMKIASVNENIIEEE